MSEQTKTSKIFVPGTQIKEFTFANGGSVLRFSINLAKFGPFVKENKNENGYINFNIEKRREVGNYGDTHNVCLDTWKPAPKTETKSAKPVTKKGDKPAPEPEEEFV